MSGTTAKFLYDGANVVHTLSATNAVNTTLLNGAGLDERYARTTVPGGVTSAYLTDALGSTLALVSSTGSATASFTYEPYGVATKTGSDDTGFRYTGREDDGTGLLYYRARYMFPRTGRFISQDPIGLAGGENLYAYVEGDPVSNTDPDGMLTTVAAAMRGMTTQNATMVGEPFRRTAPLVIASLVPATAAAAGPGAVVGGATIIGSSARAVRAIPPQIRRDVVVAAFEFISPGNSPHPITPPEMDPGSHFERVGRATRIPRLPTPGRVIMWLPLVVPLIFPDAAYGCE